MLESKTIVVALGGNAILKPGHKGTFDEQNEAVKATCDELTELALHGNRIVITHGNGPQVGNILIRHNMAAKTVPPMPLDVCGAESEGQIGYMIQRNLGNALRRRGLTRDVLTVVTQMIVDHADPAFKDPTKPIGPFYSREIALRAMAERHERWVEDSGRGWRKVMPSPEPIAIVEQASIRRLLDANAIVIAAGGGGIPVVQAVDGTLRGVEAVIDKDLAAERLAAAVQADVLMILTDVHHVALNFHTAGQRDLDELTPEDAHRYIEAGHFSAGSMLPKVKAATRFVEKGGQLAVICYLEEALEALEGKAGTRIARALALSGKSR